MASLRLMSLSVAQSLVGVEEVPRGSNWGPQVSSFIRETGYDEAVYWCLCYVYASVNRAAKALGVSNPLPRTGDCDMLLAHARKHDLLRDEPAEGDIFLKIPNPEHPWDAVHAGFVKAVLSATSLRTLEGNSNGGGSNNGYAVVDRQRNNHRLVFVRWYGPIEASASGVPYRLQIGKNPPNIPLLLIAGTNWAPVRAVVRELGLDESKLSWDANTPGVAYGGSILPATPELHDGVAFMPVRKLGEFFGLKIASDDAAKVVHLTRF